MTRYNLPDEGSKKWYSDPLYAAVADLDKRIAKLESHSNWITLGSAGAPTFFNSFTNVSGTPCQIRKDPFGVVWMRGSANVPVGVQGAGSSSNMFTLPAGWWPMPGVSAADFIEDATTSSAVARIFISTTTGIVTYTAKVGTVSTVRIDCSFPTK